MEADGEQGEKIPYWYPRTYQERTEAVTEVIAIVVEQGISFAGVSRAR